VSRQGRSITDDIATFASTVAVPAEARAAGVRSVLDTLGALLAGCGEPVVRIVATELVGGSGPATLVGLGRRAGAADAALVNATAAHAIDYDDVHSHVRGHPSACVLPAALAVAEQEGRSGAALLDAYVVGIEVMCRVGRAMGPSHAGQGFHSTSTLGVLGAAAAAARALGLDPERTAAALGIAASSASGLRRNFGTMTKPLHAGNAARNGTVAALLARAGVDSTPDILDSPGSFQDVFSPAGDAGPIGGPGKWAIVDPGMAIKKYPCCNRGHRAVDGVLDIVSALDLAPAEVAAVEVRMPAGQVDDQGRIGPMTYPEPRTGLEAKFSMPYVIAAAVVDRGLPIAAFTDDAVHRPRLRELMARVRPVNRDDADDHVEVVVTTRDDRVGRRSVRFTRGDPHGGQPLDRAEVLAKYLDCAGAVLAPDAALRSADLVRDLATLPAVTELTSVLAAAG
jgi:2-methylcitrate dehydratase PrpD